MMKNIGALYCLLDGRYVCIRRSTTAALQGAAPEARSKTWGRSSVELEIDRTITCLGG